MQIVDGKLYVANSGGYNAPNYEKTVSVVDLASFTEIKKIEVGLNLNLVQKDDKGNLYISSRGNYGDIPTNIYRLDTHNDNVKSLGINASNFVIVGDSLFAIATEYNDKGQIQLIKYTLYDLKKEAVIKDSFISQNDAAKIKLPYHIAYNPQRKELYICDAKDYISAGEIFCFSLEGNIMCQHQTGDLPAVIAFLK